MSSTGDTAKETGGGLSRALLILWCTCGAAANGMANQVDRLRFATLAPAAAALARSQKGGKKRENESGAASETFACYLMEGNGFCDGVCCSRAKNTSLNMKTRRRRRNGLGRASPLTSGLNSLRMNSAL